MVSKYEFIIADEAIAANLNRLTNQIWKLLPMRENGEDWTRQLDTVIVEVAGLGEIFPRDAAFLQLLSKLEGLRIIQTDFELYRKTVFEAISLIQKVKNDE